MTTNTARPAPTFTRTKAAVPLDKIAVHPDFITRQGDPDQYHLRTLTAAVKAHGPVARVLLWKAPDGTLILLDGRYRLWAYGMAEWSKGVPAWVLDCSRKEAMIAASEDAIKDRLNLDPHEKADRAWRLVRDPEDTFSKTELARATGIGTATIARMRRRWRAMKAAGTDPTGQWWRDLRDNPSGDDTEQDQMTEAQRKAIIQAGTCRVRDALDWRKWDPAIPDDDAQLDMIAEAIGPQKLWALLERHLGGDHGRIETMAAAWREERKAWSNRADWDTDEPSF